MVENQRGPKGDQFCKICFRFYDNVAAMSEELDPAFHRPLEDSVAMLELVAISRGAEAQKLALRHLSAVQYMGVDILAFLTCISLALLSYLRRRRKCKAKPEHGLKMKAD